MNENLETWLRDAQSRHLDELFALLRIPSVSTDPEHVPDVQDAAAFVAARMAEAGLTVRTYPTAMHPIVYGEWLGAPGAPTVLIYGHYDVQPPDPVELWRSPPFAPVLENGNIVARGATDDKGQMYCHIKGIEAHMKTAGTLPVNVKVLIEGEEEVGSPSLEAFLREHAEMLRADAVVISDTPMHRPGEPSITWGLRGLAYFDIEVDGPSHDLHSGLYGGGVANPVNGLARIIASFHDPDGRVAVAGFYDDVRALSDEERAEYVALAHDEETYRNELGVTETPGEPGYTILERITARPTLDCNGILGGYTKAGAKTVLPARATAKFSCRLVPDQTPERIAELLQAHLDAHTPPGVRVTLKPHHGAVPVLVDRNNVAVRAAMRAQARVWGRETVFTRGGGSIPVVEAFHRILGLDSVLVGLGLEDDRLHSPNEKFALQNYYQGIRTSAWLLQELAASR